MEAIALMQTKDVGFGTYLVLQNDLIGQFIGRHGFWERHLFEIYKNIIRPDDVVLDAGANIGFHTIQFARLAKKVYAYEPQSLIFNILSTNILLNGVTDKVEQYRLGLGDNPCKMKMQPLSMHDEKHGGHNYGGRGLTNGDEGEEEVELICFDKDVDVIKIDVQGSEIYSLTGMESVIDRCEPWFIIENYEGVENDEKVLKFLINKGYIVYRPTDVVPNEDCIAYKPTLEKHKRVKEILELKELDVLKFKIIDNI